MVPDAKSQPANRRKRIREPVVAYTYRRSSASNSPARVFSLAQIAVSPDAPSSQSAIYMPAMRLAGSRTPGSALSNFPKK